MIAAIQIVSSWTWQVLIRRVAFCSGEAPKRRSEHIVVFSACTYVAFPDLLVIWEMISAIATSMPM